jgi:hypothetical protein
MRQSRLVETSRFLALSKLIQTVHGLGKFFDSEAPIEVNGKPIAFIGDRTSFGEPRPDHPAHASNVDVESRDGERR